MTAATFYDWPPPVPEHCYWRVHYRLRWHMKWLLHRLLQTHNKPWRGCRKATVDTPRMSQSDAA